MKILINGSSLGELVFSKNTKNELTLTRDDILYFDKVLSHLKRNKKMYMRLVFLIALTVDMSTLRCFAEDGNLAPKLKTMSDSIIGMLTLVARYGSMGMGIKTIVVTLFNGGNLKDATLAGIHYWLVYVFLQLYPYLYDLSEGIRL